MGVPELRKQLLDEAEQQAKALREEAQRETKKIESGIDTELKQHASQLQANAQKMILATERKEIAAGHFEGKKTVLDMKKQIISRVIEEAAQELQKMQAAERKKFLQRLLGNARKEIAVKKICVSEKDRAALKEKGITVRTAPITGGLIAETADGKIIVDLSVATLLQQLKDTYLQELSEVIFSG